MTYVVVIRGTNAGRIGKVIGPRRITQSSRRPGSLVHFPGEAFPSDFRAIADGNMRAASRTEIEIALALEAIGTSR